MFGDIFKSKSPEVSWEALESVEELSELETLSKEKPVVIFKHSTRCSVSFMAQSSLKSSFDQVANEIHFRYLDLIRHRNISNEIASRFGVHHESPQLIILKGGKVIGHTSHSGVSTSFIRSKLAAAN